MQLILFFETLKTMNNKLYVAKTKHTANPIETSNSLPTRKQLQAFLQAKGINPDKLTYMNSWEQVRLVREYQQAINQ